MGNKCTKCRKELGFLSRKYSCRLCGKIFCSNCIQKVSFDSGLKELYELDGREIPEYSITKFSYVLCPTCARNFQIELKTANKAILSSNRVELVSIRYMGKKRYGGASKEIMSDWHKDKEDCREDLKRLAALNTCSIVIDVEEEYDVKEDGNYKYKVFRMRGKAYQRRE